MEESECTCEKCGKKSSRYAKCFRWCGPHRHQEQCSCVQKLVKQPSSSFQSPSSDATESHASPSEFPGSPFHVGIAPTVNASKVKCYGPGLDSREVVAGKPATFIVDTTETAEAPLDVSFTDSTGE